MGAWGTNFDESDGCLDFLGNVEDNRNWAEVENCILTYVEAGGYEEAEEAWAALELVAAALGRPSPRLSPDLAQWAAEHGAEARALKDQAIEAAGLIGDGSELSELWEEAEEADEWRASIVDLKTRLGA